MNTQKTILDIGLLSGHPALDFVNTVDSRVGRWGPDFLNNYHDLVAWACRLKMIDEREADTLLAKAGKFPSDAESELTRAKELREALYRLFLCESRGNPIGPEDLALVAAMAQRARSQQTLMHAAGVIEWRHVGAEDLNEIGDRLAHFAVGLLTSRQGRRPVRACLGPNCGWLFLDESRGGHRQWCSDKTCGSHARVRKFRAAKAD